MTSVLLVPFTLRAKPEGVGKRKPREKEVKKTVRFDEAEAGQGAEEEGWEVVRGVAKAPDEMTLPEMKRTLFGKSDVELDHDMVSKKRKEIVATRGKKVKGNLE